MGDLPEVIRTCGWGPHGQISTLIEATPAETSLAPFPMCPRSQEPALQADSLPAELTGEPKRPRLHSEMPFPISLPGFKSSSVSLARFESHILAPAPKWEGNGMTCV